MSDIAERYERVTSQFTERVRAVPEDAWDNPSPCEGWTARDVVGHLTGWIPAFFGSQGLEFPPVPSVADDPVSEAATRSGVDGASFVPPGGANRTSTQ